MQQLARMDERPPHQRTRGARQGARVKSGGVRDDNRRMMQIEKRMARWLAMKVSMMGVADNRAGSEQRSRDRYNN
jgi:hypothetical protein